MHLDGYYGLIRRGRSLSGRADLSVPLGSSPPSPGLEVCGLTIRAGVITCTAHLMTAG